MSGRVRIRAQAHRRLTRLHRWVGISCVAFVVLLSITGLALNHTERLGLDRQLVSARWLLGWYGVEAPAPAASYMSADRRVTLMGNRLYIDDVEIAREIDALVGAASAAGFTAVATPDAILLIDRRNDVVDRMDSAFWLPGDIDAIAPGGDRLLVSSAGERFAYDVDAAELDTLAGTADDRGPFDWSRESAVPPDLLQRIERNYRGAGLTLERLLYDIHSGRFLSAFGVWLMDLVALGMLALGGTGLYLWLRR